MRATPAPAYTRGMKSPLFSRIACAVLLLLSVVLVGCGNKGDLVRPGAPPAAAEE